MVATYDLLFKSEKPEGLEEPFSDVNNDSKGIFPTARFEPSIDTLEDGEVVQFERLGYFCRDISQGRFFHRTVGLRDEWANIQKRKRT